jgi:hypothetical protein
MKFSSKLALVAAASLLSVSAFAADLELGADLFQTYVSEDIAVTVSTEGGAYIHQSSTGGAFAHIDQSGSGNFAFINQTGATVGPAVIMQETGTGNYAVIIQH